MAARYNRYLAVAARVVRRSLKDDKRIAAESRGNMELKFAKWQVRLCDGPGRAFSIWEKRLTDVQGGKQGEVKPLAQALRQVATGQAQ